MIPAQNIIAWSKRAPWAEQRQVEQDLIISRALVELFNDDFLKNELRFRGGTALNKLHFPKPLRYSEDIDLVRTTEGPIGPILDRTREILEPWLGKANFKQSKVAPKLYFTAEAEDKSAPIRLKLEINTWEREAFGGSTFKPFAVENPWFTGKAEIHAFSNEEVLATKVRALLQRDKGRDLIDLSHALTTFSGLDVKKTVELTRRYLELAETPISRAQAEERMFAKLGNRGFLADVRPLLTAEEADRFNDNAGRDAFSNVFATFIANFPGDPWAKTPDMLKRFGFDAVG
ncbi:MAG: nucleotidyl transferase AbiEii/AbiGii toxin family protein [Methylocystis sp.]